MTPTEKTAYLAKLRADIEAGKQEASRRLKAEFGTDDGKVIFGAILAAIPGSASPAAALNAARKTLAVLERAAP